MSDRRTCPVVGLVGGVGSGKSALARRAAERFGIVVIDGDAAGHRALADSDVKAALRQRFGEAVFAADGSVHRSALAEQVFGDSAEHAGAKNDLERITHPVIRREIEDRVAAARASDVPAVLIDAAVMLEAGWQRYCDGVVFIEAPEPLRRSRTSVRGWSESDWRRREAAQLPLEEKRRRADAVVANTGSLDAATDALIAAIESFCGVRLPERSAAAGLSVPC